MYRQIYRADPPAFCSFCGGPLSDYHDAQLPPLHHRIVNLLRSSTASKIDELRRHLYL